MSDLEELFKGLKSQPGASKATDLGDARVASIWDKQAPASPSTNLPIRQIMPRGATEQSMSNNLLNLLNIKTGSAPQRSASAAPAGTTPLPGLARLPSESSAFPPRLTGDASASSTEPPANTQRFLLDLLNKPGAAPAQKTPDLTKTDQAAIDRLAQSFSNHATSPAPPKIETPGKANRFTYVNPFDQLTTSSPLVVPPKAADAGQKEPEVEEKPQVSVAEKLEQIGEQASKDIGQALDKALSQVEAPKEDDDVRSSWSTAEDEVAKQEESDKVECYNFPMRPFVTIELIRSHAPRSFRNTTWSNTTPVARLKKDFSHDDRTLATASSTHILYTVVPTDKKPSSGLKVIRQEDGKNKQIWSTPERLCSVQIGSSESGDVVLATGVNGSIFYTELPGSDGPALDEIDLEARGFWMTPPPNSDEPGGPFTTSSAIRTRAKLSNRHPSARFAVARGRQIHIIHPNVVRQNGFIDVKTNRVDTDRLLGESSTSINTGKAGKDFCFSEDDTVLASLDKVGKIKFWNLARLTSTTGKVELKDPIHSAQTHVTLKSDEKLSPSSILFVDKERAYSKKVALRYLLIGYQQNQILQLWDLILGKAVQELRFPDVDGPDSDGATKGMCSITYHPKTSIITVGHPGRNSVYFMHLSSPKYSTAPMSQAVFLTHISSGNDTAIEKPTSTAIMSGIREYSCARMGQLRSLDILKTPYVSESTAGDEETIFELYIMHSKGVLAIPIARADLGWDAKGKMVKPMDAEQAGFVTLSALPEAPEADKVSAPSEPPAPVVKIEKEEKPSQTLTQTPVKPSPKPVAQAAPAKPASPANETPIKNNIDDILAKQIVPQQPPAPPGQEIRRNPPLLNADTYKHQEARVMSPASSSKAVPDATVNGKAPAKDLDATLDKQFAALYSKLDADKRIAEAAGAAKQDAMLRLVSSTLTDNVENSLTRIVMGALTQQVLPALSSNVLSVVDKSLTQAVPGLVKEQITAALPGALATALQQSQLSQTLAREVAKQVDASFKQELKQFKTALESKFELQHAAVVAKYTEEAKAAKTGNAAYTQSLQAVEGRLVALLSTMQAEQAKMAAQIATLQQTTPAESINPEPDVVKEEPTEVDKLTELLNNGDYEPATIQWLQSEHQAQLFDDLFVRINPAYLQRVSPLIALSVSIAVTSAFEVNVAKRLEWLSSVLDGMDINDAEIRDVGPKIMDVLIQRLQGAYMQIAESRPTDQVILRKLAALNRQIGDIRKAMP